MCSHMIARRFSVWGLLALVMAPPAFADNINSDMMLSGPSAEPMRLTVKHPKNTPVHITIITDPANGGVVEFSAPQSADPSIAYAFPKDAARNVTVFDAHGQEVWSLIDGEVRAVPNGADTDGAKALLAQLDRSYSILPSALQGAYTLRMRPSPEFLSTTDFTQVDPSGTNRQWAHRRRPALAPSEQLSETTILISPSAYVPAAIPRQAPMQ